MLEVRPRVYRATNEEIQAGLHLVCPACNGGITLVGPAGRQEAYCPRCHISVALFEVGQTPVNPVAQFQ